MTELPAHLDPDAAAERGHPARIGRYDVQGELGRGPLGRIVRAFDPELARAIAIKLVSPEQTGEAGADRLRAEAQAMARLTHPNVVTIYDVGTADAGLYIAMELVDGDTLRGYARAGHSLRDRLAVCVRAGRGLAAAHEAGLVHRDFRPDNVLCATDGRVLVSDFGLAGTQGYLAPELLRGEPATPASDQFAYCVTVDEVLHGVPLPAHVRAALARGLARDPAARWPSMTALVDELARDPVGRRRRTAGLIALGVVAAAGGAIVASARRGVDPAASCTFDERALGAAWTPARRTQVAAAIDAAHHAELIGPLRAAIDDYATSWLAVRRDACLATHVRDEQSAAVLDGRVACLDGASRELGELTTLLATADATAASHAIDAVYRLPAPADCTAAAAARTGQGADAILDPATAPARAQLERAWALLGAGRPADAAALAGEVALTARMLGAARLDAEALLVAGRAAAGQTHFDVAQATLYDALAAASRAHDDMLAAQTWVELVQTASLAQHPDVAIADTRAADAALTRISPSIELTARDDFAVATALRAHGDFDEAAARLTHALAIETHPGDRGIDEGLLCDVLARRRKFAVALPHCDDALRTLLRAYGPWHPRLARTLNIYGAVEMGQGHYDAALVRFGGAIAAFEATGTTDDLSYALALNNVGAAYASLDLDAAAAPYFTRAVEMFARDHPDHPLRTTAIQGLATGALRRGDLVTAIAKYREAQAIIEARYGADSEENLVVLYNLAIAQRRIKDATAAERTLDEVIARGSRPGHESWSVLGHALELHASFADDRNAPDAVDLHRRALAALEHGDDRDEYAVAAVGLGVALQHVHRNAEAIAELDRVLPRVQHEDSRGLAHRAIALAKWALGDARGGLAAAKLARDEFAAATGGEDLPELRAEIARVIRAHGG